MGIELLNSSITIARESCQVSVQHSRAKIILRWFSTMVQASLRDVILTRSNFNVKTNTAFYETEAFKLRTWIKSMYTQIFFPYCPPYHSLALVTNGRFCLSNHSWISINHHGICVAIIFWSTATNFSSLWLLRKQN